jgi:hypothetical protein
LFELSTNVNSTWNQLKILHVSGFGFKSWVKQKIFVVEMMWEDRWFKLFLPSGMLQMWIISKWQDRPSMTEPDLTPYICNLFLWKLKNMFLLSYNCPLL